MNYAPYTLFKRGKKYYVRFRKPDGTRTSPVSSGQTNERAAKSWAQEQLEAGAGKVTKRSRFRHLGHDFFDIQGPYHQECLANFRRISERQLRSKQLLMKNHILPYFGEMQLEEIITADISKFKHTLMQKNLTGNTINKCISCLKAIFEYAEENGYINRIPNLKRASIQDRTRTVLTRRQAKSLFRDDDWDGNVRARTMNRLAMITGMRASEILALTYDDILSPERIEARALANADIQQMYHRMLGGQVPDCTVIAIYKAWDQQDNRLNDHTKTDSSRRFVPIPDSMMKELADIKRFRDKLQPDSPFIFFAEFSTHKPMEGRLALREMRRKIEEKVRINDEVLTVEKQKERLLDFHSWRHFLNTQMIEHGFAEVITDLMTGHATKSMTQNYTRLMNFTEIITMQEALGICQHRFRVL
jgi:integrase